MRAAFVGRCVEHHSGASELYANSRKAADDPASCSESRWGEVTPDMYPLPHSWPFAKVLQERNNDEKCAALMFAHLRRNAGFAFVATSSVALVADVSDDATGYHLFSEVWIISLVFGKQPWAAKAHTVVGVTV